eukprot:gene3878-4236_t
MNTESDSSSSSSSNILVAVRIRPLSGNEVDGGHRSCCQVFGNKVVAIKKNGDQNGYLKSQQPIINEYAFDEVFDDSADQLEVYQRTAQPYISKVLEGYNVTVFAYGATGAGKTHTMLGNTRADSAATHGDAGIIPKAVKDVFVSLKKKSKQCTIGESYQLYLSFLEVYNEQVYDLLDSSSRVLSVREDKEKGIVAAAGLTEQPVTTYEQVIDCIIQGNKRRKTEATMANVVSSRSHAILQLVVRHNIRSDSGRDGMIESKLALIDLAGSERASATCNRGARLQEGANINKSLLALANCINALAENASGKTTNVKYRDSKLTHLLKSSLEGNGHLIMIANINPSDQTYEDSHNTLKYANRAKNIKVNAMVKGVQMKETSWVERETKLRDENNQLRQTIRSLEDKIIELEYFKSTVLANNGILPPDFELIESVSIYELQCQNNELSRVSDLEFDLSMSSLSTAQDTVSDFISSGDSMINQSEVSEIDIEDDNTKPIHVKSKMRLSPAKVLTKIPSLDSAALVEIAPREKEDTNEECANGKKRRASMLPSLRSSSRISKRQSIAISREASIDECDVKENQVAPPPPKISKTDDHVVIPEPVENPMAWVHRPIAESAKSSAMVVENNEPDEESHPDTKTDWVSESCPKFELGQPTRASLSATNLQGRRGSGVRGNLTSGIAARRKSIAHITAMLDSLQDVTTSVSNGAISAPLADGEQRLDDMEPKTSRSSSKENVDEPATRTTRSTKPLQVLDPNVVHVDQCDDKQPKSRRKSTKVGFSVDAVKLNKENADPQQPLRRSTRRASLAAQSIASWVE